MKSTNTANMGNVEDIEGTENTESTKNMENTEQKRSTENTENTEKKREREKCPKQKVAVGRVMRRFGRSHESYMLTIPLPLYRELPPSMRLEERDPSRPVRLVLKEGKLIVSPLPD
ncbi:MAG: hypothetical protein DRO95_06630 [Candidatus Altiarchaeales archaeon]|nr:MAG: hypothetical protein DRO95_06630 [Candidatus Altiarchaeales archaeon]